MLRLSDLSPSIFKLSVAEALGKAIEAREAYANQANRIHALEAEMAKMKAWDAETQKYELKGVGHGAVAYMLKPDARSTEPPHWLCPNCYAKGKKSFVQMTPEMHRREHVFACTECNGKLLSEQPPEWV
jgi:Zn finger protein HypA/HybF involved in hydrogenase expression